MEVILLGTGGPKPDPHRQGPAVAVRIDDSLLLFDAGRGVTTQLARAGMSLGDVGPVFITHHHFDHIGGLGDFMLAGWNLGRRADLPIFGPRGTQRIVDLLLNGVYRSDIDFRRKEALVSGVGLADIGQMVQPRDVKPGMVFADQTVEVSCAAVQHGHGLGISRKDWQCLAYRVEAKGQSVTISGDTVDCSGIESLAKNTDALVMCCYLSGSEMQGREGALIGRHILAGAPQVGKIAERVGAGKLILTHIRQKHAALMDEAVAEIAADYSGEIIAGRDLMTIRV